MTTTTTDREPLPCRDCDGTYEDCFQCRGNNYTPCEFCRAPAMGVDVERLCLDCLQVGRIFCVECWAECCDCGAKAVAA